MTYQIVDHNQVADLPQQLADLSNIAFAEYEGSPQADAAFCEWYLRRPGSTPELCVAALAGDRMVSNVLVAVQPLVLGGETLPCGIVDTVATHPDHRGQGLARQLMLATHERMRQAGAEAAVLYTNPANHPYRFYGRLGYETRAQAGLITGSRPTPSGDTAVRPMRPEEAEVVRLLTNRTFAAYEGFSPLDDALWDWHRVDRPANLPVSLQVAERDGQIIGVVALATVDVLLAGQRQVLTVVSDAVYPDESCLCDLLATAPGTDLAALADLQSPLTDDLQALGFTVSVGEVAMVLPFTERARYALTQRSGPWYVMVESVIGV